MKIYSVLAVLLITVSLAHGLQQRYILEHERDIAAQQPGPHNGGGMTKGYNFFSRLKTLKWFFENVFYIKDRYWLSFANRR